MKKIMLIWFLSHLSIVAKAQSFDWFSSIGGIGEDVVKSQHVDVNGNIYSTGFFTDEVDFDYGSDEFNLVSNGLYDVFITKTDTNGNLIWGKSLGGSDYDYPTSIVSDIDGNIYITGSFIGTVDFDPGLDVFNLTSTNNYYDIFILKLDASGNFLWVKSLGGNDFEEIVALSIDNLGNLVGVGFFYGFPDDETGEVEPIDFDPSPNEFFLTSEGDSNTFVLKLDSDGNFINAFRFGGASYLNIVNDFKISASGEMFIVGSFQGTADFNPNDLEEYILTSGSDPEDGSISMFLCHLGANGEFINAFATSGIGKVWKSAIEIDNSDNIYLTGYFESSVNFKMHPNDEDQVYSANTNFNSYIMKLDYFGNRQWVKSTGGVNYLISLDITLDNNQNIFTTGFFDGNVDFNPSDEEEFNLEINSINAQDSFLQMLDSDGEFLDAFAFGGVDFIDDALVSSDSSSNIYLSAHYNNSVDVNPLLSEELTIDSEGYRDSYLIKLSSENLGLSEFSGLDELSIYPNPTNDWINFTEVSKIAGKPYTITTISGKVIAKDTIPFDYKLSIRSLSQGVYFLNINNLKTFKIFKS